MNKIVGVVTCKSRLDNVKTTCPAFLNNAKNAHYVLVDYNCPEKTGQWVNETWGHTGRVHVVNVDAPIDSFNKSVALNAGGRFATDQVQADYIVFLDADTIVLPGFIEQIQPLLDINKFIFPEPSRKKKDLTGTLVIPVGLFNESGGYSTYAKEWGGEDIEFRTRLYVKHKKEFDCIDPQLDFIDHDDDLRTVFYHTKDIRKSSIRNMNITDAVFYKYRGIHADQCRREKDSDKLELLLYSKPL